MNRQIKLRIVADGKIIGYEEIINGRWKWMCPELNPDSGERWTNGSLPDGIGAIHNRDRFTGLRDKNGVEMYEGDILKDVFESGKSQIIIYLEDMFMVSNSAVRLSSYTTHGGLEVIGNIHEHKHLLAQ